MSRYRIYEAYGHWFIAVNLGYLEPCIYYDTDHTTALAVLRDLRRHER